MLFQVQKFNSKKRNIKSSLWLEEEKNEKENQITCYFYILNGVFNKKISFKQNINIIYNQLSSLVKNKVFFFKNEKPLFVFNGKIKELKEIEKEFQSFKIEEKVFEIPISERNDVFSFIGEFLKKTKEGNVTLIKKNPKYVSFFGNQHNNLFQIQVMGISSFVERESLNLNLFFNTISGFKTIQIEIETILKAMFLGPRQKRISLFMFLTKTKIYIDNFSLIEKNPNSTKIFISGIENNILLAKEKINKFFLDKRTSIQKESFLIQENTLESLSEERKEILNEKLKEFGVFLSFAEEKQGLKINLYGENDFCIKKIKEEINKTLFSNETLVIRLETEAEYSFIKTKIEFFLKKIECCNVLIFEEKIVVKGKSESIFDFVQKISCARKEYYLKAKYIIENPIETKDFLCGKKNGKLLNIIKKTNVSIQIIESDKNGRWGIEIDGDIDSIFKCMFMFRNEFLAVESFYVDPKHHKELIGSSGQTIQKLIKEYCVYIKFFEQSQVDLCFGTKEYFLYNKNKNIDNVLMKTPMKNKESLFLMKKKIFERIKQKPFEWKTQKIFFDDKCFFWLISFLKNIEEEVEFIIVLLLDKKICLKISGEMDVVKVVYKNLEEGFLMFDTKNFTEKKKIEHLNNLFYCVLSKKANICFELTKPFLRNKKKFFQKDKTKNIVMLKTSKNNVSFNMISLEEKIKNVTEEEFQKSENFIFSDFDFYFNNSFKKEKTFDLIKEQ